MSAAVSGPAWPLPKEKDKCGRWMYGMLTRAYKLWDAGAFSSKEYKVAARLIAGKTWELLGDGKMSEEYAHMIDEEYQTSRLIVDDIPEFGDEC